MIKSTPVALGGRAENRVPPSGPEEGRANSSEEISPRSILLSDPSSAVVCLSDLGSEQEDENKRGQAIKTALSNLEIFFFTGMSG